MRFAVFTHVEHQYKEGKYFAYAPYVREMNIWFGELELELGSVEVVAPLDERKEEMEGLAYQYPHLKFTQIPAFDLLSLRSFFTAIYKGPVICLRIFRAMNRADFLHLRCPGNIGLL